MLEMLQHRKKIFRKKKKRRGREREKRMKRKSYFPSSLWPVYVKFAASL